MSKSSQSTNFRKVNVDDLDEDRFQDDAGETQETVGPSEGDVQNLLNGYVVIIIIIIYFFLPFLISINKHSVS